MAIKIILYIFTISIISNFTYAQTNSFKLEEKFTTVERAKQLSDSLKRPVLISEEYVFSIGDNCYKNFIAGIINERNNDGENNDRYKDGNFNDRNKGGAVADRQKKGKKNNRNKGSNQNERDNDGDINDRNKDGKNTNRNSDGSVGDGPHCSNTENGKLLLYTRHNIKIKTAYIFFENQTFNNKHFKIKKL